MRQEKYKISELFQYDHVIKLATVYPFKALEHVSNVTLIPGSLTKDIRSAIFRDWSLIIGRGRGRRATQSEKLLVRNFL